MVKTGRVAITTAFLVPLVAGPVDAQRYPADLGLYGGFSWYSKMLSGNLVDEFEGAKFKAGPLVGAQAGFWFTPRIGARANLAYANRPLEVQVEDGPDHETLKQVNLWSVSGDLLIRFREPNSQWRGTELLPYVAFGVGGKWITPAGRGPDCFEGPPPREVFECHPFEARDREGFPPVTYALAEGPRLMGLVGLGTDVRFAPNFAVRLELNDRIYKPDIFEIETSVPPYTISEDEDSEASVVNEIGAQIGLHLLVGGARRDVVAGARQRQPQPRPRPQPAPIYTPPGYPAAIAREEAITVCVVDLNSSTGIRTQNAIFLPERGDTMVVVNGERTLLRNTVGHVMVARDADWYIRGQPLVMNIGNNRVQYLTYQRARYIDADRLAFLGTINGYPVYADRDEVADIIVPIQTLRAQRPGADLGTLLVDRRDLRDRVENIRFLYVPLEPTGCVFQTVQVMEQVRKGKR